MKVLMISSDDFEDTELLVPYYRLKEENIEVAVASFNKRTITGKHGYTFEATHSFDEVNPGEYDFLIVPGGKAPERFRLNEHAKAIAKQFMDENKLIATICHGIQLLTSIDAVRSRKATCYIGVQDDLRNAGAEVLDEEVVVDGNLISSRHPSDLPAFMREIMKKIRSVG